MHQETQETRINNMFGLVSAKLGLWPPALLMVEEIPATNLDGGAVGGLYFPDTHEIALLNWLPDIEVIERLAPHELAHAVQIHVRALIPHVFTARFVGRDVLVLAHDPTFAIALALVYNVMDDLGIRHHHKSGITAAFMAEAGKNFKADVGIQCGRSEEVFELVRESKALTISDAVEAYENRPGFWRSLLKWMWGGIRRLLG